MCHVDVEHLKLFEALSFDGGVFSNEGNEDDQGN